MNENQPAGNPSNQGFPKQMNDDIMRALKSHQWKHRVLTAIALTLGLVSILASVGIAWANFVLIVPKEVQLLRDYPRQVQQASTNAVAGTASSEQLKSPWGDLHWQHMVVTVALGKGEVLMAASVALLGVGTLVMLLLVILNRRVTLRHINLSLAQISSQMKDLQGGSGSGSGRSAGKE